MAITPANPTHTEGPVAKMIEQQTAKVPSDWFLWAAVASIATSLTLKLAAIGTRAASSGNGRRRCSSWVSITNL